MGANGGISGGGVPALTTRTLWAALVGFGVTATILWTPYLGFGVRSPEGHLVLDSVDACIGLLVAYLLHLRFRRSHRLRDLLLVQGLMFLVVGSMALGGLPSSLPGARPGSLDIWVPLLARVMGAVLIGASGVVGERSVRSAPWQRWEALGPVLVVAASFLVLWSARAHLPRALDLSGLPTSAQHPVLTGHPLLLVGQGFAAVCFFVAAAAFTAQGARSEDELVRWLGPACLLGAFARVNYLLFPSLYTDWLYTGDVLRTGCYLLLLVGAGREIQQFWNARAEFAVLEDRRRLARELHDGVVQELGYIRSETFTVPAEVPARAKLVAACDRALDEARGAVTALGGSTDEPLAAALQRAVRDLEQRYGVTLHCSLDPELMVSDDHRHALVRITREAVSNAARHGRATDVWLSLRRRDEGWELCVKDNGQGFDPSQVSAKGYGLVSMGERARALPGSFHLESTPGAGSAVRVVW